MMLPSARVHSNVGDLRSIANAYGGVHSLAIVEMLSVGAQTPCCDMRKCARAQLMCD
jgi:hypothetical protein